MNYIQPLDRQQVTFSIIEEQIEPVLGTLINFTGMRRIWTRGIQAANKFMLGAAIAYNLKKWLKFKDKTAKVIPMAIKVPKMEAQSLKKLCFFIFDSPQHLYCTML